MATKADYLAQIDADLEAETEDKAVLRERRKRVKEASTDEEAARAYLEHVNAPPEAKESKD